MFLLYVRWYLIMLIIFLIACPLFHISLHKQVISPEVSLLTGKLPRQYDLIHKGFTTGPTPSKFYHRRTFCYTSTKSISCVGTK